MAIGLRAAFVTALIAGAALQIQRWRSAVRVAGVRRQIEWAALGMFVGLLPYGVLVLLPRWLGFGFEPFSWVMVLSPHFCRALRPHTQHRWFSGNKKTAVNPSLMRHRSGTR